MCSVSASLSQHEGVSKCGRAGGYVHGCPASKVETSHLGNPACGVPGPAGNGVVDERGPDEHENHAGEHAAAFGNCAYCEGDPARNQYGYV